nr:MAG: capsid protein [Canine associated porprismacovirus]
MATQSVTCSYQEIIDLHTESDRVSVIGIHTPTGDVPKQMFSGFYKQFKKFRYLGASLALVPAARLPADPLQVSYEAGEPTIDPRDMLNPIMFHGCHGNDMGAILNQMYNYSGVLNATSLPSAIGSPAIDLDHFSSADMVGFPTAWSTGANNDNPNMDPFKCVSALYYKALTDNTWMKANPQRGFKKKGLRPLVYNVATTHQLLWAEGPSGENGLGVNVNYVGGQPTATSDGTMGVESVDATGAVRAGALPSQPDMRASGGTYSAQPFYDGGINFLTNKLQSLGWLDTYQPVQPYGNNIGNVYSAPTSSDGSSGWGTVANATAAAYASTWQPATLPRVYMGMMLLPPAYKTEQYFRLVLNHRFAFAGFRGISMQSKDLVEMIESPSYFNANGDEVDVLSDAPSSGQSTAINATRPLN